MTCPFKIGDRVEDTSIKIRNEHPQATVLEIKRIQGGTYTIRVKYFADEPNVFLPVIFWPIQDYRLVQSRVPVKSGFSSFITQKGL